MKVIILGCGRVGSQLATMFDKSGHSVVILDNQQAAFSKRPETFKGKALLGSGMDVDLLKKAGIEEADAFIAVTQGDNRNIMFSEMAKFIYDVPKVITRVYDPIRCEMFGKLGLETICPTTSFTNVISDKLLNEADSSKETAPSKPAAKKSKAAASATSAGTVKEVTE